MYKDNVNNLKRIQIQLKSGTYCYYNIAKKWNAMVGDKETAKWGSKLILELLGLVDTMKNKDDTLRLYQSYEWKEIIAKTGPVEAAYEANCLVCNHINIGFGISGFLEMFYIVDYEKKTITWHSCYDESATMPDYSKCAKCGGDVGKENWISPYIATKGYKINTIIP